MYTKVSQTSFIGKMNGSVSFQGKLFTGIPHVRTQKWMSDYSWVVVVTNLLATCMVSVLSNILVL